MVDRVRSFGIMAEELPRCGPEKVYAKTKAIVDQMRNNSKPAGLILNTCRLGPHSKGDDIRPQDELRKAWKEDPLNRMLDQLEKKQVDDLKKSINADLKKSFDIAKQEKSLTMEEFWSRIKG